MLYCIIIVIIYFTAILFWSNGRVSNSSHSRTMLWKTHTSGKLMTMLLHKWHSLKLIKLHKRTRRFLTLRRTILVSFWQSCPRFGIFFFLIFVWNLKFVWFLLVPGLGCSTCGGSSRYFGWALGPGTKIRICRDKFLSAFQSFHICHNKQKMSFDFKCRTWHSYPFRLELQWPEDGLWLWSAFQHCQSWLLHNTLKYDF